MKLDQWNFDFYRETRANDEWGFHIWVSQNRPGRIKSKLARLFMVRLSGFPNRVATSLSGDSDGFRFHTIGWDHGYDLMDMWTVATSGMEIPILWSTLNISSVKIILAPIRGEQVNLMTDLLDRIAAPASNMIYVFQKATIAR